MAKKPKKDPYSDQAAADAIVRFGPEYSALAGLLRDAVENRDNELRAAKGGKDLALSEIAQAGPFVQGAYQGAQQAVQPAFQQAGGIEASALTARLGEAGALAKTQLEGRRLGAIQGASAEGRQAIRDYATSRDKINKRAVDLGQEQGAFIASQIAQNRAADAAANQQANELGARLTQEERNSIRGAGLDPDQPLPGGGYAPIPGGRLDPKAHPDKPNSGHGWASQTAQASASDEIQRLLDEATANRKAGETRADTADLLLHGADKSTHPVYEEVPDGRGGTKRQAVLWKKGDKYPDGNPIPANLIGTPKTVEVPALSAAKSKLLLQAALDMAYDGHLSRRTQKLLHQRGIQLGPLGLTTFQEWLKTPAGQEWLRAQRNQPRTRGVSNRPSTRGTRTDPYGSGPGHA